MATTIITKNGSGAPTADDLSVGELAVDLTNKRLYSKNSSNAVIELGVNAAADTTFGDNVKAVFGDGSDLQIYHTGTYSLIADTSGTGPLRVVTNTFQLNNAADTENMINAAEGGAVTLYNAGNAKLATTSTGVDVTGTVTADGLTVESSSDPTLITLRHTGNTSGFVIKNFSGAESQLVNVDNGPMVFKTNDTEAMRIDSSGNVGIGITPQSFAKLQVKTATDRNVSIFDNAAGATICGITDAGASTSLRLAGSNLIFTGDGGGGAEAMRIDTSGNVGIGTQSPVSPLTTSIGAGSAGSLNNQIAMTHSGASNSYHIKTIRATANDEPAGLAFVENTTERMRIDSNGNVGIGAVPGVKLHVEGNTDSNVMVVNNIGTAPNYIFDVRDDGVSKFRVDPSGKVGIGTSSPADLLHVKGSTSSVSDYQLILEGVSGGYGAGISFQSQISGGSLAEMARITADGEAPWNTTASTQDSALLFFTTKDGVSSEALRINAEGDIKFNTSSSAVQNAGGELYLIGSSNIRNQGAVHTFSNSAGSSEYARIDSSGNLLVGTTDTSLYNNTSGGGIGLMADDRLDVARDGDVVATFNRMTNDGSIIQFYAQGALEGSIDVSGSTVSLVGFSGAHASSGVDVTTAKGTVVSTIDQEHKSNHAKIKVSDSEGDARVYGVIDRISEEGDIIVSGVGIGEVKVTGACAGGDLLESNGDGTAKVQSDDIIRSKTIGKVTIGNSDEGVKLVSCVLYCG
jgi:hypothetical protein